VSVALKCTRCGAASVSSLFYRGPGAHACRLCDAPFELADPARERRLGLDRRARNNRGDSADWRTGIDRRRGVTRAA
jgi:hypothetical protein